MPEIKPLENFNKKHGEPNEAPANVLKETEDYYFNENGLIVFTKTYHLKRGYCCKNNCSHCPYDFKTKVDEE